MLKATTKDGARRALANALADLRAQGRGVGASGPEAGARRQAEFASHSPRQGVGVPTGGEGVPCWGAGGEAWTSEDADDRAEAVEACAPCPVLKLCKAAGRYEVFGVWGGVDRERTPRARRPELGRAVLLALATAPAPSTAQELVPDVSPLLGTTETALSIALSINALTRRGHATNVSPPGHTGRYSITAAGMDAAEGEGRPHRWPWPHQHSARWSDGHTRPKTERSAHRPNDEPKGTP